MTRVLVAGIGNVLFRDDAFGVEVVRQLAGPLPAGARAADFGIRAIHLAYELLAAPALLVVVDCMSRGGAPGTLYLVEPGPGEPPRAPPDAHGMNLGVVFATVRELGGVVPPTLVVGCEPETIEPGLGLSAPVTGAVPEAIDLIRDLITRHQETT